MEKLQFILHEHEDRVDAEGNKLEVSTFGYKFTFRGKQYGDYVVIKKPSMTAQDVMKSLELLCPKMERYVEELQAAIENIDL